MRPKKNASKPKAKFVILDASLHSCCSRQFNSEAAAEKEAKDHINENARDYVDHEYYFVAKLVKKIEPVTKKLDIPTKITEYA